MVDIVRPLKIEDNITGTQTNYMPTETNVNEDYLGAKGIALKGSKDHLIDLDGQGNIRFKDSSHPGYVSLKEIKDKLDKIHPSLLNLKIWRGVATVNGGNWSVNYTSAGFTQIPEIYTQASATGTRTGDANYSSVRRDTITTTGCSGRASNATTVGLLLATVNTASEDGLIVSVLAIGV